MSVDHYTPELAASICERISSGESLRAICRELGAPTESAVRRWAITDRDGFGSKFAAARHEQAHALFDEILDTARAGGDASLVRARVDALKWAAARMAPKIYGEKSEIAHSGSLTLEQLVLTSMAKSKADANADADR